LGLNNQVLWLVSELLTMVKSHQDQYESNNSALDAKLADYQSRGLSLLFLRKRWANGYRYLPVSEKEKILTFQFLMRFRNTSNICKLI
jgi:hypothetical protein